jgi:hypothetical protein
MTYIVAAVECNLLLIKIITFHSKTVERVECKNRDETCTYKKGVNVIVHPSRFTAILHRLNIQSYLQFYGYKDLESINKKCPALITDKIIRIYEMKADKFGSSLFSVVTLPVFFRLMKVIF